MQLIDRQHPTPLGILMGVLVVLFGLAVLPACGGSTDTEEPPPRSRDRAGQADRGAGAQSLELPSITDVQRHSFARNARDPFTAPVLQDTTTRTDRVFETDCDADSDPIGMVTAQSLRVLGLLTGTAVPKALVLAGNDAQAHIVTEGTRVGPRCSNRIVEIRDNEVVIAPFGADDDERRRIILVLSEQPVDAEIEDEE